MRGFLQRVGLLLAIQLIVAGVVAGNLRLDPNDYMAAFADKERLAATTPGPRIVLVGGSNVAFSVNATRLTELMPGYRAINLGLHAGLGSEFILNDAARWITPGDVVVLSLEYGHFTDNTMHREIFRVLEGNRSSANLVPLWYVPKLLDEGVSEIGILTRRAMAEIAGNPVPEASGVYSRTGFDADGDEVAHWRLSSSPFPIKPALREFSLDAAASLARRLEQFQRLIVGRGGTLVFVPPAVPEEVYRLSKADIAGVLNVCRERLQNLTMTNEDDIARPLDEFYDAAYHMTREGGERRTMRLAQALTEVLRPPLPRSTSIP